MSSSKYCRRSFLKTVGAGAALLPLLPSSRARAANGPKRLVIVNYPNGIHPAEYWPTGGETDFAYANGKADFDAINRDDIPMLYSSYPAVGHFGTYSQDNGGAFGKVAIAWLRWTLMGDEGPAGKGLFAGENSPLAQDAEWVVQTKHLE